VGASEQPQPNWLIVGCVCKPHGVHGDVLVEILTDFPERLTDGASFGLGAEDGPTEFFQAHRVRYHKRRWLLSVEGIRDRNQMEEWRGRYLFMPEQELEELPEGYYYEHHLVGLECWSPTDQSLGTIAGVDVGPGQTRLVVRRGSREFLVPYVPEIVTAVDLDRRRVVIDSPPGLLDDDAVT
jgi:16S rRNA processing protein RimM